MISLKDRQVQLVVIFFGVVFVGLNAWTGFFDELSASYLQDAMLGSGAIYATARGINGLVSVLQGTELDVWLATFAIGELLDPLNDLIERFSGVMTIVLASLALQALILGICSNFFVDCTLAILGLAAFLVHRFGSSEWAFKLVRIFFVSLMVRLSMVFIALAGHAADQIFFNDSISALHKQMKEFQTELKVVSGQEEKKPPFPDQIKPLKTMVLEHEQRITTLQGRLRENQDLLKLFEKNLRQSDTRWGPGGIFGSPSPEVLKIERDIKYQTRKIEDLKRALKEEKKNLNLLHEQIECMQLQAGGQSCSFLKRIFSIDDDNASIGDTLRDLASQLNAFAMSAVRLMATLLFKSVLLPICFLLLMFRLPRFIQWLSAK